MHSEQQLRAEGLVAVPALVLTRVVLEVARQVVAVAEPPHTEVAVEVVAGVAPLVPLHVVDVVRAVVTLGTRQNLTRFRSPPRFNTGV